MRAALLLLKLLNLVANMKFDDTTLENTIESLKRAIGGLTSSMSNLIPSMPANEEQQAQALVVAYVQLAVASSRQMGRSKSARLSATANEWVLSMYF